MTTKQAILEAIEQLPEQHQEEVLRYVQQLTRTEKSPAINPHSNSSNPLVNFIGAVSGVIMHTCRHSATQNLIVNICLYLV